MRDKYSDLMLILIKDILVKYKHIKFILIGTAASVEFFQKYFNHVNMFAMHKPSVILGRLRT